MVPELVRCPFALRHEQILQLRGVGGPQQVAGVVDGDALPEVRLEVAGEHGHAVQAFSTVRDEPDPRRKLRRYGEFIADTAPRHVPIQLLVGAAADADADAAESRNRSHCPRDSQTLT